MSGASSDVKLGTLRRLREEERALITKMAKGTPFENEILHRIGDARVRDMPDGGMGSIKFCKRTAANSIVGKQIAEGAFQDVDGVPVSATLSLDNSGNLFELDIFKADGSSLLRYPDLNDFKIIHRYGKLGYAPK